MLFVRGLLRELDQLQVLYYQSELNWDGLVREVKADNLPEGKNPLINSNRVNQQPPSNGSYFFVVGCGLATPQACKKAEITVQTDYRWRKEYDGLKLDQAKRLKEVGRENAKSKRLVAELSLEKQILKDVAGWN